MTEEKTLPQAFKLFDKYDVSNIEIKDIALRDVINLEPKLVVKSEGRHCQKFGGAKVNIIERLMNKLSVAGHRGKKHRIILNHTTGQYSKNMKIVLDVLEIIEKKTGKNPVQILVTAIENAAPRDEITVIEYGGARYPQAVDSAPLRRINLALRAITHGASDKAFGKKKNIVQALSEEIMLAADNNGESFSVKKKNELEKQANSAR